MTDLNRRIVFFGTPEFAVTSLDALVNNGYEIAAVVTAPDKPAGRGHRLLQSAVKQYAIEHDIPVLQPVKLKDPEFIETLRTIDAELFIVIAFRMLPEIVWAMPPLGTFNLHGSLLPAYRGAAPINWAIINGDKVTGVTTFFINHEIDKGDVIAYRSTPIDELDNAGSVHDRLAEIGAELTVETVKRIFEGNVTLIAQSDMPPVPDHAIEAPKIFRETCLIDWTKPASAIHNLVRGLSPYPAAWTEMAITDNQSVTAKIFKTALGSPTTLSPGTVVIDNGHLYIASADRLVEIIELQPNGKRPMSAPDYLRGLHLT